MAWKTNSYNIPYISSMLPGTDVIVLHLLKRKQGFYVKKGNPKRIQSFEDLKRADVTIVNREPGSGVRVLVDEKLRQAGISTQEVNGYQKVVNSHLEAAAAVNRRSRCGSWKRKAQPVCTRNRFYFHTGRKLRYGNPKRRFHQKTLSENDRNHSFPRISKRGSRTRQLQCRKYGKNYLF